MPDTGAPWNIPYVEPSDLVRTYPAADELQALAIAAGLTAAANPGIGSNVVQTIKFDTFTTSSTSFVDVTGFTVTITPTSATSKVLVIFTASIGNTNPDSFHFTKFQLRRGSTNVYVASTGSGRASGQHAGALRALSSASGVLLDSPETTSAVTYSGQIAVSGNVGTFNRPGVGDNNQAPSHLTVIEVAA